MRNLEALRDFFNDLTRGDPVALILGGIFLFFAVVAATIWIVDLRRRANEKQGKKPFARERSRSRDRKN